MKINESDLHKLATAMENKKLSVNQVIELIENSNVQSQKVIDTTDEIKLAIDYTKTIKQVIADGEYDYKNSNVTSENFPISPEMIGKKVEVSAKLFHFNHDISSNDAISKMDKDGYRPAALMELLTLGFLFPELQRQFPIVALGSVWCDTGDDHRVLYLEVYASKRKLDFTWFDGGWSARCRFLGVRK